MSLHTVLALDFPQYLPAIFQGIIPRKIAGKYMENLKQTSGEIFVGRMKNFRDKCIENLKKWFLHMQLHAWGGGWGGGGSAYEGGTDARRLA